MSDASNKLAVPIAIVIAGALIAGAVIFTTKSQPTAQDQGQQPQKVTVKPVSKDDHILGNPDAKVVIVEYSDMECPFCKRFHSTMLQVMDQFGKDGTVAWVYRHYPIDQLHSKARKEAEATECVNELGGSEKFWQYLNKIYSVTPSNNQLDPAVLSSTAVEVGIDKTKFDECMTSGKFAEKIEASVQDGQRAGVEGTPYSMAIAKNGNQIPISGAQPFSVVAQIINALTK